MKWEGKTAMQNQMLFSITGNFHSVLKDEVTPPLSANHDMKVGGLDPPDPKLSTRCRRVVNFLLWPLNCQGKNSWLSFHMQLGRPPTNQ